MSVGFAGLAAVSASAANNPGTGDSGFFTFRPAAGVGGTQINVASGNALVRTRDLADGSLTYHVVVDRFYNSLDPDSYTILSPRWGFDVGPDAKLTVESNQDATVRGPSGYRIRFVRQPDGSYVAPEWFDGALVKTSSGWTLSRTSQNDEFGFDGSGTLTWTKDSSLRDFTVQGTSAAGRTVLSSYGTNSGRRVNLSYTTSGDYFVRLMDNPASGHHWYRYAGGRLSEYESPTGQVTSYGYDANGFLDEIVEPGGTTVELDVRSSGKVNAITTTLPGGVPQTTSFVYTRRTYKSDVTAPDTTRRTYAYDDDWRVTRDYDPDVVPTVTASGELRDLADDYVGPNRTYPLTVAADQPDGAGLRRLLVERSSGTEIEGEDVPCTATPFDLVCPTNRTTSLDVSFASVPEGEQTIRAAADDDEEHHATSDGWKVLVDRMAPSVADTIRLSYFDPESPAASATINWNLPTDPSLPGDIPGSGIDTTEVRYRINGGAFSPWLTDENTEGNNAVGQTEVSDGDLSFFGGQDGDLVVVEIRSTDAVGNTSTATSTAIELEAQLEDPEIETISAELHMDEYGTSEAVAREWMRVQDRSDALSGTDLSSALPNAYGGVWLDNAQRRIKVGVVVGHDPSAAEQVIDDAGLASRTDIVFVANTQRQLEEAQVDLRDELEDLLAASLITIGRTVQANSIKIEVSTTATPAQRARVAAVAGAAPVSVDVVTPGWAPEDFTLEACTTSAKNYYCDPPLRGGVGIGTLASPIQDFHDCTVGFNGRLAGPLYTQVSLTAGHCSDGLGSLWYTLTSRSRSVLTVGPEMSPPTSGSNGDLLALRVADSGRLSQPRSRIPAVLVNASFDNGERTTRRTNYGIRGVGVNRPGRTVCMSGATTGTHCFKIASASEEMTLTDGPELRNMAMARSPRCLTAGGDSGGPYFKWGLAMGIHTGSVSIDGGCSTYYTSASVAEQALNMKIDRRK